MFFPLIRVRWLQKLFGIAELLVFRLYKQKILKNIELQAFKALGFNEHRQNEYL